MKIYLAETFWEKNRQKIKYLLLATSCFLSFVLVASLLIRGLMNRKPTEKQEDTAVGLPVGLPRQESSRSDDNKLITVRDFNKWVADENWKQKQAAEQWDSSNRFQEQNRRYEQRQYEAGQANARMREEARRYGY